MSAANRPAVALTVVGGCCVVLGGLVAAVTAPLALSHGSWLAAYLVLVGGVAQFAMGAARSSNPKPTQSPGAGWTQLGAWNVGDALVIGGTLTRTPLLVDVGSALLVVALVIAFLATRTSTAPAARPSRSVADGLYRVLLVILAASIPVGIVLSHLRHH